MKRYKPPYIFSPNLAKLHERVNLEVASIHKEDIKNIPFELQKSNKIKIIQATLAIEANSLTLEQVTDYVNGKRILGPEKDILELKQALELYNQIEKFDPLNIENLFKAHKILMEGLVEQYGYFRKVDVGIYEGRQLIRKCFSPDLIEESMLNLFEFLNYGEESWLLKSTLFHCEFEIIHPFEDGNGRMGRFWQQILLMKFNKIFQHIPVDVIVQEHRYLYYNAIQKSYLLGDYAPFIEFSLKTILRAFNKFNQES